MITVDSPLYQARLFAALSGPFEPKQALQSVAMSQNNGSEGLVMAASQLAEVCDTSPAGAEQRWLMRTPVRYSVLKALTRHQLVDAVEERRKSAPDGETADLLAVLLDEAPLAQKDIRVIIESHGDRTQLERVILALDRAGDAAPAKGLLQPARAALAGLMRMQNLERVVDRGFCGREPETDQIAEWLSRPSKPGPVICLFLTGAPGIGKSTLLAESVRRYQAQQHSLILRLDFDRAGLDVLDQLGLTMEAARQFAEQLGDGGMELLDARLEAGGGMSLREKQNFSFRQQLPDALATKIGKAVTASGRPVLVVLDTLEVLRGRGETHPETLFRWLDELASRGVEPMHVLAAGRGDALDSLRQFGGRVPASTGAVSRVPRVVRLELPGLERDAALALLEMLQAPQHLRSELLRIAQGNPLKLRMATEIARKSSGSLPPQRKLGQEVTVAFLYRLLLSRIEDPDLRRLAHPGLIVRRINADLIREVLAPTLGFGRVTQDRAEELLRRLGNHHWLMEHDPGAPGFLKHRSDTRVLLLPLLYQSSPKLAAKIDAAAVRWFGALSQPWAQVEAVYHQLQLTRTGRSVSSVPLQVAVQFDSEALDELPRAAADLVRTTRGQRTSQFRSSLSDAGGSGDGANIAHEILTVVKRQDWGEGSYLVRRLMEAGGLDVRSQGADAIRTFLWRSGQWAKARRWLTERDRFSETDGDLSALPDEFALARLEMRAEFDPEGLRKRWEMWFPVLQRLESTAVSASDNTARHGALALVLASLPHPYRFPGTNSREGDPVFAASEHWGGGNGEEAARTETINLDRLSRVASHIRPLSFGRVLAVQTPYAAVVNNLVVVEEHAKLRDSARLSAKAIAQSSRSLSDGLGPLRMPPESAQISWLADLGLFAEWAEVTAFIQQNKDLRLVGRAAERWRRTMAGDWSIGRARGAWRDMPRLDETLAGRLRELLNGQNPVQQAREQLVIWGAPAGLDELLALVRHRLEGTLAAARRLASGRATPDVIALQLLARGAPAAFAPALVVLTLHREL